MKRRSHTEFVNPHQLHGEHRLNKILASAGLGSRRQVDELIEQGRVSVDGVVADQLGAKVDIDKAKVTVDGEALKRFRPFYYALNKPTGVLCTNRDPQGRPRAVDLIPGNHRLFPVGRLDASSVGLLLMTNDGELTQRLTHPKHGVPKTYFVVVAGHIEPQQLRRLQRGIYLSEGLARVEGAKIRRERKGATELEITLCEGKNREIRRVLARIGNKVVLLRRISIGPLKLADLPEGAYRPLSNQEVAALYQAVEEAAKERKRKRAERDSRTSSETEPSSTTKLGAKKKTAVGRKKETLTKLSGKKTSPTKSEPSQERDPFAWDDDDALLAASPFGDQFTSNDDDFDDDEVNGGGTEMFDDEDSGDATGLHDGMILVDEGEGRPSRGKVIDYSDDGPSLSGPRRGGRPGRSSSNQRSRSFKKRAVSEERPRSESLEDRPRRSSKKGFSKGIGRKKRPFKKGATFGGSEGGSRPSRGKPASGRKGFKASKGATRRSAGGPMSRKKSSPGKRRRRPS